MATGDSNFTVGFTRNFTKNSSVTVKHCTLNVCYLYVRVLVYVSFPFVRSDYVISAGVGFRVVSGVVASP